MVWLKQHLVVRVASGDTSDKMDVNIGGEGRGKVTAELIAGAYPVPLWEVFRKHIFGTKAWSTTLFVLLRRTWWRLFVGLLD